MLALRERHRLATVVLTTASTVALEHHETVLQLLEEAIESSWEFCISMSEPRALFAADAARLLLTMAFPLMDTMEIQLLSLEAALLASEGPQVRDLTNEKKVR